MDFSENLRVSLFTKDLSEEPNFNLSLVPYSLDAIILWVKRISATSGRLHKMHLPFCSGQLGLRYQELYWRKGWHEPVTLARQLGATRIPVRSRRYRENFFFFSIQRISTFKGTVPQDFRLMGFSSVSSKPLSIPLWPFQIFSKIKKGDFFIFFSFVCTLFNTAS